jgi:hypothetical protein
MTLASQLTTFAVPLDWEEHVGSPAFMDRWIADTVFGTYQVFRLPEGFGWRLDGKTCEKSASTLEAAKSGAQADFESRVRALIRPGLLTPEAATALEWIRITSEEDLPKKPGLEPYEYVDCLIFHEGKVKKRPWNCEHRCFDDEDYDDFFCNPLAPTHYAIVSGLARYAALDHIAPPKD